MAKRTTRLDTLISKDGRAFPVTVHETVFPVDPTIAEMRALNTLCDLERARLVELGANEHDRIEAWLGVDNAQDKILAVLTKATAP